MPRTKTGTVRKQLHKKTLKLAKGYRMTRNRLYKVASEAVLHAGQYAYNGRKERKQQMRTTWIERINAAVRSLTGIASYSKFIKSLSENKIQLNRKSLSALATNLPQAFKDVAEFSSKSK